MIKSVDTKTFIEKSKTIHGDKYDYSNVIYIKNSIKVEIKCPIHGTFYQIPANHVKGGGCKKCALSSTANLKKLKTEDVVNRIKNVHGELYNLDKVIFEGSNKHLTLGCKDHGDFRILFYNIYTHSQGCPKCVQKSSFTRTSYKNLCIGRKGFVYLIRVFNDLEEFYKIGISVNLSKRFYNIRKVYRVEIIDLIESPDGEFIFNKEKQLHKLCKKYKYKPQLNFAGNTECFKFCSEVLNIWKEDTVER